MEKETPTDIMCPRCEYGHMSFIEQEGEDDYFFCSNKHCCAEIEPKMVKELSEWMEKQQQTQ